MTIFYQENCKVLKENKNTSLKTSTLLTRQPAKRVLVIS